MSLLGYLIWFFRSVRRAVSPSKLLLKITEPLYSRFIHQQWMRIEPRLRRKPGTNDFELNALAILNDLSHISTTQYSPEFVTEVCRLGPLYVRWAIKCKRHKLMHSVLGHFGGQISSLRKGTFIDVKNGKRSTSYQEYRFWLCGNFDPTADLYYQHLHIRGLRSAGISTFSAFIVWAQHQFTSVSRLISQRVYCMTTFYTFALAEIIDDVQMKKWFDWCPPGACTKAGFIEFRFGLTFLSYFQGLLTKVIFWI